MARALNPAALREIRDLVGLTQRELASRSGITQGTVTNLERGIHGASPALVRKFADVLGVRLDAITSPVPEAPAAEPEPEPEVAVAS
jgi:transcriptional regulator with XRE-family HTH domain